MKIVRGINHHILDVLSDFLIALSVFGITSKAGNLIFKAVSILNISLVFGVSLLKSSSTIIFPEPALSESAPKSEVLRACAFILK